MTTQEQDSQVYMYPIPEKSSSPGVWQRMGSRIVLLFTARTRTQIAAAASTVLLAQLYVSILNELNRVSEAGPTVFISACLLACVIALANLFNTYWLKAVIGTCWCLLSHTQVEMYVWATFINVLRQPLQSKAQLSLQVPPFTEIVSEVGPWIIQNVNPLIYLCVGVLWIQMIRLRNVTKKDGVKTELLEKKAS